MRRPRIAAAVTLIPLVIVGLPFLNIKFGFPDDRILPTTSSARQVGDHMRSDFTQDAGLPVHIVHGAQDWMFPSQTAAMAERVLQQAGANVVYREIADLSHTYPRDENGAILDWFLEKAT